MYQRLEPYALMRRGEEQLSPMGENTAPWEAVGTIRAAVSAGSGGLAERNELLRIDSTHTAVTWDTCKVGDRFGGYEIVYIVPGGRSRMHLLYLKKEETP